MKENKCKSYIYNNRFLYMFFKSGFYARNGYDI